MGAPRPDLRGRRPDDSLPINWRRWHHYRDLDDARMWFGRRYRVVISSLDVRVPGLPGDTYADVVPQRGVFEDAVALRLDFAAAWSRLRPIEQRLLVARVRGASSPDMARRFGSSRSSMDSRVYQARRHLAELMA